MTRPPSPDDLPPPVLRVDDHLLRQHLDDSLTVRFDQQCSPILKALLVRCEWSITTQANVVTLVVFCPDAPTNWQVLYHVTQIGRSMAQFSQDAKICVYPPMGTGGPFEIRVDELSIYQELSCD